MPNDRLEVAEPVEVKLYSFCDGQLGINVLHFEVTNKVGTGCTLQEMADQLSADISGPYCDLLCNDATFRGLTLRTITVGDPSNPFISTVGQSPGSGGTQELPTQVSGIITWRTAFGSRRGRGRSYIPFPSTDEVDTDGTPTAGYVTRLGTYANAMQTSHIAGGGGNTSTMDLFVKPAGSGPFLEVLAYTAQKRWGTQRRRGNYGALNTPPF